jgi:hypothetical protein
MRKGTTAMLRSSTVALAGLLAVGCASQNLRPRSAAEMRERLMLTVVVPDLQRLQQRATPLLAALGMPIELKELMAAVHPAAGADEAALDRPIAGAMVTGEGDGEPSIALAMHATSEAAAAELAREIEALEPEEGDEGPRPGVAQGTVVLTAPAPLELALAGSSARQAQNIRTSDDLLFTLFADGMARSEQTDVRRALDQFVAESVAEDLAELPATVSPAARAEAAELLRLQYRWMTDAAADVERIEVGLSLASDVSVSIRFIPRGGSALASAVSALRPPPIRPAWIGRSAPAMFGVMDLAPFWSLVERQARWWAGQPGPGRPDVVARLAREKLTSEGGWGFAVHVEGDRVALDQFQGLVAGVDPDRHLDEYAAAVRSGAITALNAAAEGRSGSRATPVREGDVLRLTVRDGRTSPAAGILADALGMDVVTFFIAVRGGSLVTTTGLDARPRLDRVGVTPAALSPEGLAALEKAKGANGFVYGDVTRLLVPLFSAARRLPGGATAVNLLSTVPGLAQQRLPVLVTWTGGQALDFRASIPAEQTLAMAAFLRPLLAGGGFELPGRK